jgi:hypothetical protein
VELEPVRRELGEDAVQDQRVEVDIEIRAASEALDHRFAQDGGPSNRASCSCSSG